MIISNSTIAMRSQHQHVELHSREESFRMWVDDTAPQRGPNSRESVSISPEAKLLAQQPVTAATQTDINAGKSDDELDYDFQVSLLQMLVEKMTGRKMRLFDAKDLQEKGAKQQHIEDPNHAAKAQRGEGNEREGWGMEYSFTETHYESEQTGFHAQGEVQTADGRTIKLDLKVNMQREHLSYDSVTIKAGDALKDPLVLNLANQTAGLTSKTFAFDLDADGTTDNIATLRDGSVMLALDKNSDGVINDGSELFGAISGDGFADLAQYDGDNNGWIDENDTVYARLTLWSGGEASTQQTLQQAGVGAIYLGKVDTPYSLKDANNDLQGQIRATGLYLRESGLAGSMQQIDIKV